jgi:hypothetical protein
VQQVHRGVQVHGGISSQSHNAKDHEKSNYQVKGHAIDMKHLDSLPFFMNPS